MDISLAWLNRYLDPAGLSADEAEDLLTFAGFPIESRVDLPGGDVRLDVEITSNRGDCLSHIGLAREVAACGPAGARRLVTPDESVPAPKGGAIGEHLALENRVPDACPRFTARLIRGVKVGPSPDWLVEALEAVGQRSINNVVDVTNWLTFEYGQPSHVFDLAKLAGQRLVIRWATEGEALTTLDGKPRKLRANELVVADAERAQSLAGVIGGADSEVSEATTDVVLEAATWDPVTIRDAARRHAVRTDASYRFERIVDPRTIDGPAARAAAMIVELAGGQLCEGVLDEGTPRPTTEPIVLRPAKCNALLGLELKPDEIMGLLRGLEIEAEPATDSTLRCTPPPFRPDLLREVDLIEEVARTRGYDAIPMQEKLSIRISPPQVSERARRELETTLTGLGFFEAVTFSFVSRARADVFMPEGQGRLEVSDERRKAEPALRPSVLPGLLACRKLNQDARNTRSGGIRLFETASTFAQGSDAGDDGQGTIERRRLALLVDIPGEGRKRSLDDRQKGIRLIRGAVEAAAQALGGPDAPLEFAPATPTSGAWNPEAYAEVRLDGRAIGGLGLLADAVLAGEDLDVPVAVAEVEVEPLLALYPPRVNVTPPPAFPGIERDLSIVVGEDVTWSRVASIVRNEEPALLEAFWFIGTYRGKQLGAGLKSVTLRLRFRDPSRTLRHEEVDPQVSKLVEAMRSGVGAELRGSS